MAQAAANQPTNGAKDSLVKYDTPTLISEKPSSGEKTDPSAKKKVQNTIGNLSGTVASGSKKGSAKLPPVLDQSKAPSQIEEILNSIIPAR